MEDILELYCLPYDPKIPLICMDEQPRQLIKEIRKTIPARPGESRATKADNSKAKEWFGWQPKIVLEEEIYNHRDYYLNKWKRQ